MTANISATSLEQKVKDAFERARKAVRRQSKRETEFTQEDAYDDDYAKTTPRRKFMPPKTAR